MYKLNLSSAICAIFIALTFIISSPEAALATPAFAVQTSQACSACHIGAYGPQLKPYGRDFKLYGYTADDGKDHFPPIAIMARGTYTNTKQNQNPPPADHFGSNDNIAIGEVSLFYTGKITDHLGAYLEPISYDGASRKTGWANSEVRYVHDGKLFGQEYVAGLTVNNAPTVSDVWNSTSTWGWPYDSSALAPTPVAGTLLDGATQFQVAGGGFYAMINDWVYVDAQLYHGLSAGTRNFVGDWPVNCDPYSGSCTDTYKGVMPYWKLALQHSFDKDKQNFEIGTLGMIGDVYPSGDNSAGAADRKTDIGFDANYQWLGKDNEVSAHAIYIHENLDLHASEALSSTNPTDKLNQFKTNVSYSYKDTWTPTIGYFRTWGTDDAAYWGTSTGSASPNSEGYIAELMYVPWGKEDSPITGANVRFELQYTDYTRFDGLQAHAENNNTIFFNIGIFFDPVATHINDDSKTKQ